MKHIKRMASFLLALVMVMSLAVGASAATETGTITINPAVKDQTYSIYKIFELESYQGSAFSYKIAQDSPWRGFVESYVTIDEQGYVTGTTLTDAGAEDFAKAALAYAKEKNISANESKQATGDSLVFEKLALGYYLVDSTMGALCGLTTTHPSATVSEKNEAPSVDKEVEEEADSGNWGKTNDAEIGETVNFKATITVQKGTENYILHDTMSAGLTYTNVTSVKIGNAVVDTTNYTVSAPGIKDQCTFEVSFKNEYIATLTANTKIDIYYSATVDEDAVIASEGNPNNIKLQYGDLTNPKYTPESTTTTYVWEFPVFKYTGTEKTPVAGAAFSLYTDEACTDANIVKMTVKATNIYSVRTDGTVTQITTDGEGKFKIEGLDSGVYYLKEITAPAGYNKLANPVKVEIIKNEDNTCTIEQDDAVVTEVGILNNTGTELPSTGGMGTTLFYVIGGILVLAAVVLLVTKKRMNSAE